jgi:hypothetical protein
MQCVVLVKVEGGADIIDLVEKLISLNRRWLRAHPETPGLYESGVRYQAEPPGEEFWLHIPYILMAGVCDCEDLVAYRVAWLREVDGEEEARPDLIRQRAPGLEVWHVRVRRADGSIEDPSRILGMR